ncbi:hypothetical protein FACS189437_10510 [Bacteroidia bacterium]|nr:hypothetical protein FACS189437_10510 [Bacteroidia bacterium]
MEWQRVVGWSGGSPDIAMVDDSGLVTAVSGAGEQTTVTVTTVATLQLTATQVSQNEAAAFSVVANAPVHNGASPSREATTDVEVTAVLNPFFFGLEHPVILVDINPEHCTEFEAGI